MLLEKITLRSSAFPYSVLSFSSFLLLQCHMLPHGTEEALGSQPSYSSTLADAHSLGLYSLPSKSFHLDCKVPLVLPELAHALLCPFSLSPDTWKLWPSGAVSGPLCLDTPGSTSFCWYHAGIPRVSFVFQDHIQKFNTGPLWPQITKLTWPEGWMGRRKAQSAH